MQESDQNDNIHTLQESRAPSHRRKHIPNHFSGAKEEEPDRRGIWREPKKGWQSVVVPHIELEVKRPRKHDPHKIAGEEEAYRV